MDQDLQDRLGAYELEIERNILTHGCSMVGVFATKEDPGPSFTYSIGLTDRGWPELILVGLRCEYAGVIINSIVARCTKGGRAPVLGEVIRDCSNLPLRLGSVSPARVEEYLCQSVYRQERVSGPYPTALQIVMCDRAGLFPGEAGFDHEYMDPHQLCLAPDGEWDFDVE